MSAKNIKDGKLLFDDIKYISNAKYDNIQKRCQISKGDFLLTKSGSLGMPALVEADFPFGVFESLAALKYDRERLNGLFLHSQVSTDAFQSRLLRGVKGIAVKHLHLNVIGETEIIVSPIDRYSKSIRQLRSSRRQIEIGSAEEHRNVTDIEGILDAKVFWIMEKGDASCKSSI